MRTEFGQCHGSVHWHAITDHMQVGLTEIDEALATRVFDEGVTDIPLLRYGPIQYRRTARYLMELERNPLGNSLQSRAHAMARNATAERKQLCHKAVHGRAAFRGQRHQIVRVRHHNSPTATVELSREDSDLWHRNNKLTSAPAVVSLLLQNFIRKVPSQQ